MATQKGAFVMGSDFTDEVDFFMSDVRAIFPMSGIKVSRSMRRVLNARRFEVTFDRDFGGVIRGCRRPIGENWITPDIIRVYEEIHAAGWAHSVEVWLDGELVGGSYGLALRRCFSAESMFHRVPNASKVALYHLILHCADLGFELFDAQVMNPHLASLGAEEMWEEDYLELFHRTLTKPPVWGSPWPM